MLHHVPYAVAVCGIVGIPFRMLLDVKTAWPALLRLLQYHRGATTVVHYTIIATPCVECADCDAKLIEEQLLAA